MDSKSIFFKYLIYIWLLLFAVLLFYCDFETWLLAYFTVDESSIWSLVAEELPGRINAQNP